MLLLFVYGDVIDEQRNVHLKSGATNIHCLNFIAGGDRTAVPGACTVCYLSP
jgi:hypothetical protein